MAPVAAPQQRHSLCSEGCPYGRRGKGYGEWSRTLARLAVVTKRDLVASALGASDSMAGFASLNHGRARLHEHSNSLPLKTRILLFAIYAVPLYAGVLLSWLLGMCIGLVPLILTWQHVIVRGGRAFVEPEERPFSPGSSRTQAAVEYVAAIAGRVNDVVLSQALLASLFGILGALVGTLLLRSSRRAFRDPVWDASAEASSVSRRWARLIDLRYLNGEWFGLVRYRGGRGRYKLIRLSSLTPYPRDRRRGHPWGTGTRY